MNRSPHFSVRPSTTQLTMTCIGFLLRAFLLIYIYLLPSWYLSILFTAINYAAGHSYHHYFHRNHLYVVFFNGMYAVPIIIDNYSTNYKQKIFKWFITKEKKLKLFRILLIQNIISTNIKLVWWFLSSNSIRSHPMDLNTYVFHEMIFLLFHIDVI